MAGIAADPFFEVKAEVETSLYSLATQLSAYTRLSHSSASDELAWSLSELKATLDSLENDLEELEESVRAVEEPGVARRLGVRDLEVKDRRAFLERVRAEILSARRALGSQASPSLESRKRLPGITPTYQSNSSYPLHPSDEDDANANDSTTDFEMQHQSMLMKRQDETLVDISGTVEQLREMAKAMGQEVYDQNTMLDELDHHVDRTSSNLERAQRKMQTFVKENSSSPSSWCVLILIAILTILLVFILFF